jgi:hypothetical protein
MKLLSILSVYLAAVTVAKANFYSFATTKEEHHAFLAKSLLAFVGHAEIISMKYLGEGGRVLTPEEVAASKPFCVDPLFYTAESPIRRIEFSVRLIPEQRIKGEFPPDGQFTFTYSNSLIGLSAQHPRTLHQGQRMTFYINEKKGSAVTDLSYGSVEGEDKKTGIAGTGQPATRTESNTEGSDKPQTESEGRSR